MNMRLRKLVQQIIEQGSLVELLELNEQAKKRIQVTFDEWKECNFTYRALWSIESGLTLMRPESRGLQGYS